MWQVKILKWLTQKEVIPKLSKKITNLIKISRDRGDDASGHQASINQVNIPP